MTRTDRQSAMRRALALAARGLGYVEPNPPVGAVLVGDDGQTAGEGFHERFGGPHAEINAIAAAGSASRGATLFVTLEPCDHTGKTPPCTEAILQAGIKRVIVATPDPAPRSEGSGIERLRQAGLEVEVGLLEGEARALIAPFTKLMTTGRPFVHAKWAMTLDGKIASRTGDSKWISGEPSREIVHRLRGRMDAILVGIGTVLADDPLLTARPPGPRIATRIILDSRARLPPDSQLARTVADVPVLDVVTEDAPSGCVSNLERMGIAVVTLPAGPDGRPQPDALLDALGQRQLTNLLIEGGGEALGAFIDRHLIDYVHVFVAPRILGGSTAPLPVAGVGAATLGQAAHIRRPICEQVGEDTYVHGMVDWPK